jgi:hypothetical protein
VVNGVNLPTTNIPPLDIKFDIEKFMANRTDIFGFSARECDKCLSLDIVPQHFTAPDEDGFHKIHHQCKEQALFQTPPKMCTQELTHLWIGQNNISVCAVELHDNLGEVLVVLLVHHTNNKLIRIPIEFDNAIELIVNDENHWANRAIGKKQIVLKEQSELMGFLLKTNGSTYGTFKVQILTQNGQNRIA